MVTTRVNREFADQVERLANTKREFFSAVVTDFSMILAMQTDRNRLDKLGDYVLRRPVRLAALMSERPDPILLSAMAGDRALRNLAGLDSTGTDGEKLDYVTTLEAVAATAARDYVRLCQTDPVEARAQAARWSANRSGVRSSFLREGVEAAESTYGVATDAITDRASGRRPLLAPPPGWQPTGVMVAVNQAIPDRLEQRLGDVPLVSKPPDRWIPMQGNGYQGWDRVRTRLIAKGGIGRAEQLARRSFVRVPLSKIALRYQLRTSIQTGPDATRDFLKRVASNPRRAATLMTMDVDPMVVAAALGPNAMKSVVQGQPVPEVSSLARLCDAMVRRDRQRVNELREDSDGPAGPALRQYRVDGEFGPAIEEFVNHAWDGADASRGLGDGPLAIDRQATEGFYETWQKLRTGEIPVGGIPDAVVDRIQEIQSGKYESAPQGWADVVEDYSDLADPDRQPRDPPPVVPRDPDPVPDRPPVELTLSDVSPDRPPLSVPPDFGRIPATTVRPGQVHAVVVPPGQEGRFTSTSFAGGGVSYACHGDPEIDSVSSTADGDFRVYWKRDVQGSDEAAAWAVSQVMARQSDPDFDHALGARQAFAYSEQVAGRGAPDPPAQPGEPDLDAVPALTLLDPVPDRPPVRPLPAPSAPGTDDPRVCVVRPDAPAADAPDRGELGLVPVSVASGQEGKFTRGADGSWTVHGDPEIESVSVADDGSYHVKFRPGVEVTPEAAQWAASHVHERLTKPFDHDLAAAQARSFDSASGGRPVGSPVVESSSRPVDDAAPAPSKPQSPDQDGLSLADPAPGRPEPDSRSLESVEAAEVTFAETGFGLSITKTVTAERFEYDPELPGRIPLIDVAVEPGQEGKFTRVSERCWKANGDPEIDKVTIDPEGNYAVHFRPGATARVATAAWAGSQVHERVNSDFDHDLADRQAQDYRLSQASPDVPVPDPVAPAPALSDPPALQPVPEVAGAAPDVSGQAPDLPVPAAAVDVDPPAETVRVEPLAAPGSDSAHSPDATGPEAGPDGADNPDRFYDEAGDSDRRAAGPASGEPEPAGESLPNQQLTSYHVDVPEALLTAPYNRRTRRSGDAPDADADIPEGPEFVSKGGGRWDVVDDPVVSHLTELPDGGYRVHFHPGVGPEPATAAVMASHAHKHLLDQDMAKLQQLRDEKGVAADLSTTLSRQVIDGRASCDESRDFGGGNQPVLVPNGGGSPGVPMVAVSGQAVRAWMRDQTPEVYAPEFVTQRDLEEAGGKLKPGATGVDIVRHFARDVQPFGKDGKVDDKADPVTVWASEVTKVYHVASQVSLEPPGVRDKFVRPDIRDQEPLKLDRAQVAKASGVEVIDDPSKPLGYSHKGKNLNISEQRGQVSRLNDARMNGKVLYGAAEAHLRKSGVAPDVSKPAAYLAAERLASKLRVPYAPVPLDHKARRALASHIAKPETMSKLSVMADGVAKQLVDAAQAKTRAPSPGRPAASPRPTTGRRPERSDSQGHGR